MTVIKHLSVPISKVDKTKRIVHGFATLDNIDSQGDVVEFEASRLAFERFRGNIREMHENKAVGRMISFGEGQVYDPTTEKIYSGILVSTYVSKGAADTWEKVIDGTLTGFSIGAVVNKSETMYDTDTEQVVRLIKDFDLIEISLVDNPANELANVISIEKGAAPGMLTKTRADNVFFCSKDDTVQITNADKTLCYKCDGEMVNIGFVETDDADRDSVVKALLINAKTSSMDDVKLDSDQVEEANSGAEIFEKNNDTLVEENDISNLSNDKEVEEQVADETVEESVAETVEAVEESVDEAIVVDKSNNVSFDELNAGIAELKGTMLEIAEVLKSVTTHFNEQLTEAKEAAVNAEQVAKSAQASLETAQTENANLLARVGQVEKATAVRKSGDNAGDIASPKKAEKSIWGSAILG